MVFSSECCIDCSLPSPILIVFQAGISCWWTTDSQRLILEYFDMINALPSHIYCSALKFSPSSSWLHKYYSAGLSQEVKVIRGLSASWGKCFRTVLLDRIFSHLACWGDTIAAGSKPGDIIILNTVTGSKIAIFSGHTGGVASLTFSPDGMLLVSGSKDRTIKLWDMQTGGVVKTFQGHDDWVGSVSISQNCTTIVSGSDDKTICLWNIQTGECHCIIQQERGVHTVSFFPLDPQYFMSICGPRVQEWNIDGHKIAPEYDGTHLAFSFDGTKLFVRKYKGVIQVQSSDSRVVVAEICPTKTTYCCLSPDGKLIATSTGHIAYVWNIANPEPCLIETFVGHTNDIVSVVFSSPTSLISASWDQSIKFWQIIVPSTSLDITSPKSISHISPIKSITLQAKDGIAISSDSDGIVRIWDLQTGLSKTSFQTPAKNSCLRDVQLINNQLVLVWHAVKEIYIWDVEKGEPLQTLDVPWANVKDLKISGDGSKVFCMEWSIHAWHIWTGEVMGKVEMGSPRYADTFLTVDSSKVWVCLPDGIRGWEFSVPDKSSVKKYTEPPNMYHLDFIGGIRRERSSLPGIEDTTTGKEVFRLPSYYAKPNDVQWDGQYLVPGYDSGEVIILDCNCMLAH